MGLYSQGLYSRDSSGWRTVDDGDWSAASATDLTGGGTVALGAITWTAENGGSCSTLGPDGSTGFRIVQTVNSGIVANTCPGVYAALPDILTAAPTDQLYVMIRVTAGASAGAVGVTLRRSGKYLFGGTLWVAAFEGYAVATASQFTDYSSALAGTTDQVIGLLYGSGTLQVYLHGAWTGAWPAGPLGATAVAHVGEEASSGKASNLIPIDHADTKLGIIGLRSGTNTDFTVLGHRVLRRAA